MISFGVFVSWWSIQIIGMFFCSICSTNSLLISALSKMNIASGLSSSTFFPYCSFRSGNDLIAIPLPLLIALRRIRNAQRPSTSLSKKNRGFCDFSRCSLISCSWVWFSISRLFCRLGLVL
jgi:hypothetical protein